MLQEFFVMKIRDVFTIAPAMKGILALMTHYNDQVNLIGLLDDLLPIR